MNEEIQEPFEDNDKGKGVGGRPPIEFKEEYCEQAYRLFLLGCTTARVARALGVSKNTFYKWRDAHPEFCKAVKNGKIKADAEVASALFQRAKGDDWEEEIPIKRKISQYEEEIVMVKVRRHTPPDPGACMSWLTNRQRKKWSNKVQHTGEDGKPLPFNSIQIVHVKPEDKETTPV